MERPQSIEIDLASVTTPEELQVVLAEALSFPGWYGHNWNAFWDAITGLVEMPRILHLQGFSELAAKLPGDALLLKGRLEDMKQMYPDHAPNVFHE
ncbi:barstar family protein [Silvimonas iriomotensis]|uniref:Ribonuclease inhibitor n=1 Tax=Silvimonas iriomotensis TaxID=449662 RepID=A0ABQ2PAB4_9NEIS|nr:barstar family protein [Silvimonas iriomotensis]GGP22043.1 ribonuclease inhibitor [Silvimonas iriomotensis]